MLVIFLGSVGEPSSKPRPATISIVPVPVFIESAFFCAGPVLSSPKTISVLFDPCSAKSAGRLVNLATASDVKFW